MARIMGASLVCLAALAGCGGTGSEGAGNEEPPEVLFDLLQTEYVGAEARLAARSNTAFIPPLIEGMPTTGTGSYSGYMEVELDTPGGASLLYGEADVSANFAAGTLSGSARDFIGRDGAGSVDTYAGTVGLTNGRIGVVRPNDFRVDYAGNLIGNGTVIGLSGTIDGDFKGDPIRGLLGYDTDPVAVVGGVLVPGEVGLAVETN